MSPTENEPPRKPIRSPPLPLPPPCLRSANLSFSSQRSPFSPRPSPPTALRSKASDKKSHGTPTTNGLGYTGSKDIDLCGCLDGLVNIGQCIIEYASPDGQSVWGYMTYCNQGKTQLESGTSICLGGAAGEGWVLSA
ncbi:hypothetical protein CB0940_05121 [Cercospora beticola]|uniref:Uncharacterized protein n=1 Tax=Cercospora beticola TaxID=122368 RepID=A0A2G5HL12_CERBT|nr:hypothetical protein CB0940_05121 [Cercospora beticola]PIA93256.1 hypothetical protein CB0940_05121 [Cercospora beticola]CAK1362683.1 unnamed protein product [Cercospora beticola]